MSSISSALSRLPAPRAENAGDLDGGGWAAWLRGHLDPAWRTSEWRQDCWLFTGSVHEPRSSVALCRTEACDTVVSPANIFCPFCKEEQKRSPLPDAEFARAFVPVRNRVAFGGVPEPCSFTKDGQRCVRPRHCKELCATHYTQWKTHSTRKTAGRWEDTAVPYADTPACPAPACPLPGLYGRGLCRHHAQRWMAFLIRSLSSLRVRISCLASSSSVRSVAVVLRVRAGEGVVGCWRCCAASMCSRMPSA
ncbi:hypothetical protein SAVERM_8 [Streptomyces avermitilis MA-4680 = NBRC 14893]|uniref:Uncharacterized protein n=2 Tax=Streptomyces avermitilis TaxID=33903 RepID=Q82RY4_STRAW|nr:hypothetical protein [Streptomyces sp. SID5469]BAC67717.1 hypothetical protein SAVERM_8 [Streptomyces avermitilis MA-4680 = NBRC 14893]GDY70519.1 hypothetical protein SAV31267_000040 [Streptomyces avermitilis]